MNHNNVISFLTAPSSPEPTFTGDEAVVEVYNEGIARERDRRIDRAVCTLPEKDLDMALRRFRGGKPFFGELGQSELMAIIHYLEDLAYTLRMGGDCYNETAQRIHEEKRLAEDLFLQN